MRFRTVVGSALAFLVWAIPSPTGAQCTDHSATGYTLENSSSSDGLALRVERWSGSLNGTDTWYYLTIPYIENKVASPDTGCDAVRFRTLGSPIWNIEFRSIAEPAACVDHQKFTFPGSPDPTLIPGDSDPDCELPVEVNPLTDEIRLEPVLVASSSDLKICTYTAYPDSVFLHWKNMRVVPPSTTSCSKHGGDLKLNVIVRIELVTGSGGEETFEWDIDAEVTNWAGETEAKYEIYAIRFPFLAFDKIGTSATDAGADDKILFPSSTGIVVENPIAFAPASRNQFAERASYENEGITADALFTYPGHVSSQFMAFYDDDSPTQAEEGDCEEPAGYLPRRGGLLLRADDKEGFVKNLYFSVGHAMFRTNGNLGAPSDLNERRRVYLYFTHFNLMSSNPSGSPPFAELENLTLSEELGYKIVMHFFRGDWQSAGDIYRNWALTERPRWMKDSTNSADLRRLQERVEDPIDDPTDVNPGHALAPYSFRYQFSENDCANKAKISLSAELDRFRGILDAHDSQRASLDTEDELVDPTDRWAPTVMPARYFFGFRRGETGHIDGPVTLDFAYAKDECALALRDGVPQWLYYGRHPGSGEPTVASFALNRDTAGIDNPDLNSDAKTPGGNYIDEVAYCTITSTPSQMKKKVVLRTTLWENSCFTPTSVDTGNQQLRTCPGSAATVESRFLRVERNLKDSLFNLSMDKVGDAACSATTESFMGFTSLVLSGNGSYSYPCYAPAEGGSSHSCSEFPVNRIVHDHTAGGGNYTTLAFESLAESIKLKAAEITDPFSTTCETGEFVESMPLALEHAPETQLRYFGLGGRGFTQPRDISQIGVERLIRGTPIPLLVYMFHDYQIFTGALAGFQRFDAKYSELEECAEGDDVDEMDDDIGDRGLEGLLFRHQTAQLALQGRLLFQIFSQEPTNLDESPVISIGNSMPGTDEVEDEHRFFATMGVLRASLPEYLVFGRMLRQPRLSEISSSDLAEIEFERWIACGIDRAGRECDLVLRIQGSSWINEGQTPKEPVFILTNFSKKNASARLRFVPNDLLEQGALDAGGSYKVQRKMSIVDIDGSEGWTTLSSTAFAANSTTEIVIDETINSMENSASGEPWHLLRLQKQ